ncbi:MAG: UDP-N-acetylglucosamine 2-epimerase (non-hydrolyzing) [Anaerolineaceae bacterium]|nr:UDP-N-acetylglucosamine 2-epimerase (non-hydrolyzing) [Anaerolineaceae bacterium]
MKVLSVFGTRPEAVKMAPVVKALQAEPQIESVVCVTAQHREMLDQVLDLFAIQPDVDLDLMKQNQSLPELTARIFQQLSPVITSIAPDWILVQGDTQTVMSTALLGYYHQVRVGHVEAGLRTGNKWQPFPEEVNRRVAGVVADLHFAPTEHSRQNLLREGVEDWRIVVSGNPVIDALHEIAAKPAPAEIETLLRRAGIRDGRRLVMVTAHRRENFGEPMEHMFAGLRRLAEHYAGEIALVYPVHLNPNVQEPAKRILGGVPNIHLLEPLSYLPLVHLMKQAELVLTDSGGIQEEATAMRIPTLVMREVTERPEGVEAGVLKLVGSDSDLIFNEACRLLENAEAREEMTSRKNPFGDGRAAERIVQAILHYKD